MLARGRDREVVHLLEQILVALTSSAPSTDYTYIRDHVWNARYTIQGTPRSVEIQSGGLWFEVTSWEMQGSEFVWTGMSRENADLRLSF